MRPTCPECGGRIHFYHFTCALGGNYGTSNIKMTWKSS
jgi:hypothetical protein